MIKKCKILLVVTLIFSCKESIPDPERVTLINPEDNNTCLYSNSNSNSGDVEFSWTESKHTDNYDLIVENVNTLILTNQNNQLYQFLIYSNLALKLQSNQKKI